MSETAEPSGDTSARRARIYPRYMSSDENTVNLATADLFHAEIARLQAEIERLRLTDAEREAVRFCGELCRMGERPDLAATLRGLLERTK